MSFFLLIAQALWLGLPSAISNIAPAIGTRFVPRFLNYSVDFHSEFRGRRVLGDHKTLRGLVLGISAGEVIFLLQQQLVSFPLFHALSAIQYVHLPWYFGFLFGVGALGGDMLKSFFKRQLTIPPGHTWFPFDQVDWLVGTLLVLMPFVSISLRVIVVGLCLGIVLHVIVKFVGYTLGIDSQPL